MLEQEQYETSSRQVEPRHKVWHPLFGRGELALLVPIRGLSGEVRCDSGPKALLIRGHTPWVARP